MRIVMQGNHLHGNRATANRREILRSSLKSDATTRCDLFAPRDELFHKRIHARARRSHFFARK